MENENRGWTDIAAGSPKSNVQSRLSEFLSSGFLNSQSDPKHSCDPRAGWIFLADGIRGVSSMGSRHQPHRRRAIYRRKVGRGTSLGLARETQDGPIRIVAGGARA